MLQRPNTNDREGWIRYWKAQCQQWRTESEIDSERQIYLAERRSLKPDSKLGVYPFRGLTLSRADVEWLLSTHQNGYGPVDWSDTNQWEREGLDLRGANLNNVNLEGLPLACLRAGLYWRKWYHDNEIRNFEGIHEGWNEPSPGDLKWTDFWQSYDWEPRDLKPEEFYKSNMPVYSRTDLVQTHLNNVRFEKAHLERASLNGADLRGASFYKAHLRHIDLIGAHLENASFYKTDLEDADLRYAHLENAKFDRANMWDTKTHGANFEGAQLTRVNLWHRHFTGNNLKRINLSLANLSEASLYGVDLRQSNLSYANLSGADLSGADLSGADLSYAFLDGSKLRETNLSFAKVGRTRFGAVDLSKVVGLNTVEHIAPSTIGIDTIYLSQADLPEVFLKGAGLPDFFIDYMHSLVEKPIIYYSCFISYSSQDQEFAQRLYADLQSKGVRCWFAPEDMKIGAKIRPHIDESIRLHDKLLLVLSRHSVKSSWVEKEVETAFEKESEQGKTVLFPIRLDDAVMHTTLAWAADIRRMRNIGDFTNWKESDAYQKALDRLLRDLKAAP